DDRSGVVVERRTGPGHALRLDATAVWLDRVCKFLVEAGWLRDFVRGGWHLSLAKSVLGFATAAAHGVRGLGADSLQRLVRDGGCLRLANSVLGRAAAAHGVRGLAAGRLRDV